MKRSLSYLILVFSLVLPTGVAHAEGELLIRTAPEHVGGYDRSLFKHWIDADKNGCDTRKEVLISESLVKPKIGPKCTLTGGKWISAYDGKAYTNDSGLDIDHVVPLAEAWRSGAWAWTPQQRQDFANDLSSGNSLIAVTLGSNRAKGSKEPQNWLPTSSYVCQYITDWIDVKTRWNLSVDQVEKDFLVNALNTCTNGGTPVSNDPATTNSNSGSSPKTSAPVVSETGAPSGATAKCKDGTYSFSKTRSGTCSRHGGVLEWLTN